MDTVAFGWASASRRTRPLTIGPLVAPMRYRVMVAPAPVRRAASACRPSTAGSSTRARASTNSPSGVGRAPRRSRSKSGPPRVRSMRWSCAVSAGWASPSEAAALVTLPVSAIAQITRR